jgi:hypothetical protein
MIKKKQVFGQYVYNKDLYLISLFFLVKITFQKFYLTTTKKRKKGVKSCVLLKTFRIASILC